LLLLTLLAGFLESGLGFRSLCSGRGRALGLCLTPKLFEGGAFFVSFAAQRSEERCVLGDLGLDLLQAEPFAFDLGGDLLLASSQIRGFPSVGYERSFLRISFGPGRLRGGALLCSAGSHLLECGRGLRALL
jgi:hypothetical protein